MSAGKVRKARAAAAITLAVASYAREARKEPIVGTGTDFERIVRNRSSRNGQAIRLIVLHTTEGHNRPGLSDLVGLAGFFDTQGVDASSHRGVDSEGNSVLMVPDADKAWTQAAFNPVALSIEQIGFASTSKREWIRGYHRGLYKTAEILAEWHLEHGIPLRHSTTHGVCQHSDLGAAGGGHHDCGPGYPELYVLIWARLIVLRRTGHNNSRRARRYKRRIMRAQRRFGLQPDTLL